jgi:hypothetical protein
MKIVRLKKSLFCAFLGGALFFVAYRLIGGVGTDGSFASTVGFVIFLSGCWALAESIYSRWLNSPKKKAEIDDYTAAMVEMKLEREKNGAEPVATSNDSMTPDFQSQSAIRRG